MRANSSRFPEFLHLTEQRDQLRDDLFGGIKLGRRDQSAEPGAILAKPSSERASLAGSQSPTRNQALTPTLREIQYETRTPIFFPLHVAFQHDIRIGFTEPVTPGSITHIRRKALVPNKRNKVSFHCLAELRGAPPALLLNPLL